MSADDTPMDWPDFMRPFIESAHHLAADWPEFIEMLKSEALYNAVFAEKQTAGEATERIDKIILLFLWIRNQMHDGEPDARSLAASIEESRKERADSIQLAVSAAWKAPDEYRNRLFAIASEMAAKGDLLPPLAGKRGEASWAAWCIRELDRLLSPQAIDRGATIAHLLRFVGIERSRQLITSILKKGKT